MMSWAAPRDDAQVLARSVHLHPGCHTPRRVREFVRRHTAHASCAGGKTWQCPCAEPCTRRFAIQAMRHPSASRHAQCCRKVEDDPAKLYDLIACAHELVDLQKQLSRVEHAMICSCNARSRRGGTGQTCSVQGKPQQPTKLPRAKGWRKWPVTASCSQKCLRLCSSCSWPSGGRKSCG